MGWVAETLLLLKIPVKCTSKRQRAQKAAKQEEAMEQQQAQRQQQLISFEDVTISIEDLIVVSVIQ